MDATNISINQASGVSINIEALQAIKKHLWFMVKGAWFMVIGAWSLPRLYRKELRLVRTLARMMDGHPTLSNIGLLLMGLALMVEIFLYA